MAATCTTAHPFTTPACRVRCASSLAALRAPHTRRGLVSAMPRRRRQHAATVQNTVTGLPFIDSQPSLAPADTPALVKGRKEGSPRPTKTRVVVLGSGWGAVSFIKSLDPAAFGEDGQYELVVVSPRNYFFYTPLLPSAVGGVVSENSITESIRNLMQGKGTYYEAKATDIDPVNRQLTCVKEYCDVCSTRKSHSHSHDEEHHTFTVDYDVLLCSVGAVNATFGIQGVTDNCWFLKTIEDATRLRRHISKTIELAALPDVSPEQRKQMLSFVVVGGGPTGVEVAAELHDLVANDVAKHLPEVRDAVSITLVDGQDSLLMSYDNEIRTYAGKVFNHSGINLKLGYRVTAVHEGLVAADHKDGSSSSFPFATCVWATGIAMHPLVEGLKSKLPADIQTSRRGLLVDEHLRVLGSQGTIFCLGDAAVTGSTPQTALPPTAQVARQEGSYLAHLLSHNKLELQSYTGDASKDADLVPLPHDAKPFHYIHMGSLAYLGGQKGVMDLPIKLPFLKTLRGYIGGTAYRGLETWMQVSLRTRWLVTNDWLRTLMFGRNISNI